MTDFAEFPGSEAWTRFATNCLAVVGAFIAGYVGGAIGGWAVDKWLFAKRSPDTAKKAINLLCGILLALLVAFLVFGEGGGRGWFGGGDGKSGSGTGESKAPDTPEAKDPPRIDTPKVTEPKSDDPRIRVTFLGGDAVQGDRFYKIDDDDVPKSFADLKSIVLKRRDVTAAPLTLVVLFPTDPRQRIDPSSINVAQVTSWAKTQGITITIPADR